MELRVGRRRRRAAGGPRRVGPGAAPPYPVDSDLGAIGLGTPRPSGPGGASDEGPSPGQGRGSAASLGRRRGWSQRERGPSPGIGGPAKSAVPDRDRRGRTGAGEAKAVNRNAKRLLVYILDVPSTLNQNQVVIDLARRQRSRPATGGR